MTHDYSRVVRLICLFGLLGLSWVGFGPISAAHAAEIINTKDEANNSGARELQYVAAHYTGFRYIPTESVLIDSVEFSLWRCGNTTDDVVEGFIWDNAGNKVGTSTNSFIASTLTSNCSDSIDYPKVFNFSNTSLTASTTYYLTVGIDDMTPASTGIYISTQNTDTAVPNFASTNGASFYSVNFYAYVIVGGVPPQIAPVITEISELPAVDDMILTEDPVVSFEGTCDSTDGYNTVNIQVTDLENHLIAVPGAVCLPADSTSGSFDTDRITSMLLFLGNGYYKAQAVSIGPLGEPYIFGDTITFSVAVPDNPNPPLAVPPPAPEDCAGAITIIEQASCWITQKLSATMTYLFTPSQASFNAFRSLWDPIKTKAPIGYITSVIAAFNTLSSGGAPAFTISGMSSLSDLTGPLDTVLGVILWLFIAFWLLRRIAKMEL